MVYAAIKLKAYFQAHTTTVRTDLPLEDILQHLEQFHHLTKWCIELSGYNIIYKPRKTIIGQALADFIEEFTIDLPLSPDLYPTIKPSTSKWDMYVNGALKASAPRASVYLHNY